MNLKMKRGDASVHAIEFKTCLVHESVIEKMESEEVTQPSALWARECALPASFDYTLGETTLR